MTIIVENEFVTLKWILFLKRRALWIK